MKINKTIQTEQGTVVFQGELNQDELDIVLQAGLNVLLENGSIPFQTISSPDDLAKFMPKQSETLS